MVTPALYDQANLCLPLGTKLGVGGEGAVYELPTRRGSVAKVYHKALDATKQAKLRAMVPLASPDLLKVASWPTSTLHEQPGGPVVGLVMPRVVASKEIHVLYSP